MAKFIVIKKKLTLSSLILLGVLLTLSFSFYKLNKNAEVIATFSNSLSNGEDITQDFDGDGEKETIEILKEKEYYIVKIKGKNKEFTLRSKDGSEELISLSNSWPIKINTFDLSRDGLPEIIIRGSKNNSTINYIFTWQNNDFYNIYTSNDNILGIFDSTNSKTPRILSLSSSKGDTSTSSYIFNGDKLKDISFSKPIVPGLGSVQSFVDLIQAQYEISDPPDIFSPNISSSELSLLWNLDKENYRYDFQNGFFHDVNWDDNGEILSMTWCLSFQEVKIQDPDNTKKELIIYLTIQKDDYKEFKISSIKKTSD
ncbi:hypothetical protein [Clostridium chauvoei]|uniref:VCBS repeat-containing protein n=2 Tax=Clostridium chauvoei TaxID=46867 RepID=S6F1B9_9CLOT|nr:hypothetical protein [Clostridium chauvoei]ATD55659.1 hypothetical protein BTM20_10590 [Clostridium chauvoei]ATD56664.1 hypothetical protein BTM21_02430 [Clostridium chauvoei]MBX7280103.1 hypothetical protein [Clostridium chauvoei]MBX7282587.1 hypothetical protein [Clostridium chauvoei]MBX7284994.1 hypothetical protein [Clostridium chauvoei]